MDPSFQAAEAAGAFEPERVEIAAKAQQVAIDWADGHRSRYPFWYLRGFCPCAVCQGHGGNYAFLDEVADTTLQDVLEVGHYALNFVWQDGHRTGIYTLQTLRRLCACAPCQKALGRVHPWASLPPHRQAPAVAAPQG